MDTTSLSAADAALDRFYAERAILQMRLCKSAYEIFLPLNRQDKKTLQAIVQGLLQCDVTQKEIGDVVGTSHMTVGRWVKGTHFPRSPAFLKFCTDSLLNFLKQKIEKAEEVLQPPTQKRRRRQVTAVSVPN